MPSPTPAGPTIPSVRPDPLALVGALIIGFAAGYFSGNLGLGIAVATLSLTCTAAWRALALLGYIAGALTDTDDGEGDHG